MQWIIHEAVIRDRLDELLALIAQRGDTYVLLTGRSPILPQPTDEPTVALVTVQVAKEIYRHGSYTPGVFWHPERFNPVEYSAYLGDRLLNSDLVYLPWAEFVRRGPVYWVEENTHVFVRPARGEKTFTGQLIDLFNFDRDCAALERETSVGPATLIGVCSPKPIDEHLEYRFWISNQHGIITSSVYSWNEEKDLPKEIPTEIHREAFQLSVDLMNGTLNYWYPDEIFVADYCLSNGVVKLIEINSASCSGVYEANFGKLLDGLAVEAEQIWTDTAVLRLPNRMKPS